jgi:transposase
MKREEIEKIYDQGKDAVVELVESLIARIEALEERFSKDSHNSSKPPSSDGYSKKKKVSRSRRKKSGKKNGGQEGHIGNTLEMTTEPDNEIRLEVKKCSCCGKWLKSVKVTSYERRQEVEIEPIKATTTEYQAEIKDSPYCGQENKAEFPKGITNKTQYGNYLRAIAIYFRNYELLPLERSAEIFKDIFSISLSEGTLVNTTVKCADKLQGFEDWVKTKLIESEVVHFDETGINIGGKLHWLHSSGTERLTYYFPHKNRGWQAFNAIGILPEFKGTAVHDHWASYFKYSCSHALCNAHHIRELIFVHEEEEQIWAKKLIDLLCRIKDKTDIAKEKGKKLQGNLINEYEREYRKILREGFMKNPLPEKSEANKRGRKKKGKIICLLERLQYYQKETLAFMYNPIISFDNNLAERDIRMVKVQQKISGLFRSLSGAEHFCTIRSFISTTKKQGYNVINSLYEILNENQIYLQFT